MQVTQGKVKGEQREEAQWMGGKVRMMYIACCDPNKDRDVVKEVFLLEHRTRKLFDGVIGPL